MSVTIGSLTLPRLTAQPYGFEETATRDGLTAQRWLVTGLCTNSEWSQLLSIYETWRDLRIEDEDSVVANTPAADESALTEPVLGATVDLDATTNGMTWTNIKCWFSQAPSGEQVGVFVQVTVELVDAAQAIEVLLKQQEKEQEKDIPKLGTITLGGAVIKLNKPPQTFQDIPQLQLTAAGKHYVSGPLGSTEVLDIEGRTSADGWALILNWFTTTNTTPTGGSYFPVSAPTAAARHIVENGLKVIEYTVNITLAKVR